MTRIVHSRWPWRAIDLQQYNTLQGGTYNLSQYNRETFDKFLQRVTDNEYLVGVYLIEYSQPKYKAGSSKRIFVAFHPTSGMSVQEAFCLFEKSQSFKDTKSTVKTWIEFKIVQKDKLGV